MSKRKNKINFIYKVIRNGEVVDRCETHLKRRFYNKIRMINWQNGHTSVYLRVSYGKTLSNYGKLESFYNDGDYENKEDFMLALDAFIEQKHGY